MHRSIALALVSLLFAVTMSTGFAQVLQPAQSKSQQSPKNQADTKPYQLTSRIHIQSGTQKGYLIVQVDLAKGNYVYSLTQAGSIPPSKITVAPSSQFRLLGKFSPDRPATVVENDPIFEHRVEKHLQKVQFFAPIELASGVDAKSLKADVQFQGQVCSSAGFCMPLRGLTIKSGFAGYFQSQARQASRATTQATEGSGNLRR